MDDELTLIAQTFEQDDLKQMRQSETSRVIWVNVGSVTRAEWRDAGMQGLKPEFVARTPMCNYMGETVAEYHGVRYAIYRTYRDFRHDEIELYLSREVGV